MPSNAFVLGITRFPPKGFKGINSTALAPSELLLKMYKNKDIDEYVYKQMYYDELRERGLTPELVRHAFEMLSTDVILCCYEAPGDFCHRHLLAEWLGGGIEELP